MFKSILLAALTLFTCLTAWGQSVIGIHTVTVHSRSDYVAGTVKIFGVVPVYQIKKQYRVVTPGIYWRGESGATAHIFSNSFGHPSALAGWTFETPDKHLWATVGVAWGYGEPRIGGMLGVAGRVDADMGVSADWAKNLTVRVGVIPDFRKSKTDPLTELVFGKPKRAHAVTLMFERPI